MRACCPFVAAEPASTALLAADAGWRSWQIWPFWLAGLLVAVMLMVGYRTRLASLLAFLLVISFQWRNPLILDGSDLVFPTGAVLADLQRRGQPLLDRRCATADSEAGRSSVAADRRYRSGCWSCRSPGST